MANHVEGKSIVITGAGSGFGRLVAIKTAAMGARVTCGDLNADTAATTVAEIEAAGGAAQAVACDVTKIADMRRLASAAVDAYGAIDVMHNNAGIMPLAFISDHDAAFDA